MRRFLWTACAFLVLQLALLAVGIDPPLWWWGALGMACGCVLAWIRWRRT